MDFHEIGDVVTVWLSFVKQAGVTFWGGTGIEIVLSLLFQNVRPCSASIDNR